MSEYWKAPSSLWFTDGLEIYFHTAPVDHADENGLHIHEFIEISYVQCGQCYHLINNQRILCKKGDIFILDTNVPHDFMMYDHSPKNRSTISVILINPSFLHSSLKDKVSIASILSIFSKFEIENAPIIYQHLNTGQQYVLEDIFTKMRLEYFAKEKYRKEMLKKMIYEYFILFFRYYEDNNKPINPVLKYKEISQIQSTIEYLNANFSDNSITIEKVAEKVFVSKGYLSKLFKESTGEFFSDYLKKIRIMKSCQMLLETDLSISDIILKSGFKDKNTFYHHFKAQTEQSPHSYRSKYQAHYENFNTSL